MKEVCAWCGKDMGEKDGEGISHGICQDCYDKITEGELNLDYEEETPGQGDNIVLLWSKN